MAAEGEERYYAIKSKAIERRSLTSTKPHMMVLKRAVIGLAEGLKQWRQPGRVEGLGHNRPARAFLKKRTDQELKTFALIAGRTILDMVGQGTEPVSATRVAGEIGRRIDDEVWAKAYQKKHGRDFTISRLKSNELSEGHQRKITRLKKKLVHLGSDIPRMDQHDRMSIGVLCLELFARCTDLVVLPVVKTGRRKKRLVEPTAELIRWIEKSDARHALLTPFYLPMVQPPGDWTNLHDGGYLTNLAYRRPLVKTWDRPHLAELERADMGNVMAGANVLQASRWRVNRDLLEVSEYVWEQGLEIAGLVARDDRPIPEYPEGQPKDSEVVAIWKRQARETHILNREDRAKRLKIGRALRLARRFEAKDFWFPGQFDFRGRYYPVSYFMTYQGEDLERGLLTFGEPRPIETDEAEGWLAIHGANCFGEDKVSLPDRREWVAQHDADIREVHRDPLGYQWWAEADKPWQFLAFCLEWGEYMQQGRGFASGLPVQMDGTNNGLQIFSLLTRDEIGGVATNCVPNPAGDVPRDIYQDVADKVTAHLQGEAGLLTEQGRWAGVWLDWVGGRLPRKCTKRPVMTLPYGSTRYSCRQYVLDWYKKEAIERGQGHGPFGADPYDPVLYLADLIWEAIGETVVRARDAMSWLQEVADILTEREQIVRWTAPTGFLCKQAYHTFNRRMVRTRFGDRLTVYMYNHSRDEIHARKQRNSISPNFIHSLDAAAMVGTALTAHERGVRSFSMVHDSFGTVAADAATLATSLRESYAEMFSHDILANFRDQIVAQVPQDVTIPTVPEYGSLDPRAVIDSPYFFA